MIINSSIIKLVEYWFYKIIVNIILADTKNIKIYSHWLQYKNKQIPNEILEEPTHVIVEGTSEGILIRKLSI